MNNTELIARLRGLTGTLKSGSWATITEAADELEAAQPAGEPVAWQSTSLGESILTLEQKNGNYFAYSDEFLASHTIQLYTHPAPQVPMTEAQNVLRARAVAEDSTQKERAALHYAIQILENHKIGVKP